MRIAFALAVTLVSACALSFGYLLEHSAVRTLPPLTVRHPIRSVLLLLRTPRWVTGFTTEVFGWGLYVLALALAPLSLVQATAAGGVGILAVMQSRMTQVPLARHEWAAVGLSVGGLALLGISLAGGSDEGIRRCRRRRLPPRGAQARPARRARRRRRSGGRAAAGRLAASSGRNGSCAPTGSEKAARLRAA